MKTTLDLNVLSEQSKLRSDLHFKTCEHWGLTDWGVALAGETGEVCNEIKKIKRGDYVHDPSLGLDRLAMEMADVLIYLDLLATYTGINLGNSTKVKFNHVSDKIGSGIRL